MRKFALVPIEQYEDKMSVIIEQPSSCDNKIELETEVNEHEQDKTTAIQNDDNGGDDNKFQLHQQSIVENDKQTIDEIPDTQQQQHATAQFSPFNVEAHAKSDNIIKTTEDKVKKKKTKRKKQEEEQEEEVEESKKKKKKKKNNKKEESDIQHLASNPTDINHKKKSKTIEDNLQVSPLESEGGSEQQKSKSSRIKKPSQRKLDSIQSEIYWLQG